MWRWRLPAVGRTGREPGGGGAGRQFGRSDGKSAAALAALSALPRTQVIKASGVYETEPVGYADQPAFLNAAVLLETGLSPRALLGACLGIEAAMGRVREVLNGPRPLDLDLLLYEGRTMQEEELTLPHPRMGERAFVLVPLADIFPERCALGMDFSALLEATGCRGVCRWENSLSESGEKRGNP